MLAKRILVPTDFSSCSKSALQLAVALANGMADTTVTVLHVVEPTVPTYDQELGVLEPEALRTELAALAASRDQDVRIAAEVCRGDPATQILEYAEENSIDLIVMGTLGDGGIIELLVGSTAERVMRRAACPVLTLRDRSVMPTRSVPTES